MPIISVYSRLQNEVDPYHSSSSTLKVLAFENMLSYAPIRVRMESTGHMLSKVPCQPHDSYMTKGCSLPNPLRRYQHPELRHDLEHFISITQRAHRIYSQYQWQSCALP